MDQDKRNVDEIFHSALERTADEDRVAYLNDVCGDDSALRNRVERLLRANPLVANFLESPFPGLGTSPTVDQPITECPGTQISVYKLLEQIGEGGFGVVFMAEQQQPVRRKVALKVLKPGMDSRQVIARFEAERQALAIMDHPHIAKVHDGGLTPSGRPYFVMELVKGVSITDFCDQNQLTPRQRLELFIPVCQAVQHAHHKGIVHRDLKPSNVLVTVHDTTPVVKVIDFGVAKALGQELTDKTLFTGFAQMIGTPLYMSPEQAGQSGLDVDTRSDIYSLGVLLYELLTGTTPFDKERFKLAANDEMRRIIREEDPPKPSTRLSQLSSPRAESDARRTSTTISLASIAAQRHMEPSKLTKLVRGELDWIVMKCLEKDRNRRYETASSFVADVQRFLNDEPVHACPPSRWYRVHKFARRNKSALATVSVLAICVLAAVGVLATSNARISREATEKTKALSAAKASEEEAVESLKDALAAVDKMLTRVSEERLRDVPLMEPVRRELLEDALKFYQKFLARRGDDPAIRLETSLAYRRMASLHFGLGDYLKSEDAYRKAFSVLEALDAESPLDPGIRSELVSYYLDFSLVLRNQGKFEEGEKAVRRAVAVAEDLVKAFPETPLHRDRLVEASNRLAFAIVEKEPDEAQRILHRNLTLTKDTERFSDRAQTYRNLGVLLTKQRRFVEAEDAYRHGVLFSEKALTKSPSRWTQVELAGTLKQFAKIIDTNGRPEEAETIYRRAIPMFDKFAADFPAGPHNRWGQADLYFQHALLLGRLHRSTEAEQAYRRTVELFDKLVEDFPTLPGYTATAVDRRLQLAQFLAETGRSDESQQVSDETNVILEKLAARDKSQALAVRGRFYASLGEWNKAATDLKTAMELGSDDVLGVWCPLALIQLAAGRMDEYGALCEKMLERSESHWIVGACTLSPNSVADLTRLTRSAERLVTRDPNNADFIATLGFALYRNDKLEDAAQKLETSLHLGSELHVGLASKLVLVMAYHRLGRGAEAQPLFQEVTKWMDTNAEQLKERVIPNSPLDWAYRVGLQALHSEAQEILNQEFKK